MMKRVRRRINNNILLSEQTGTADNFFMLHVKIKICILLPRRGNK